MKKEAGTRLYGNRSIYINRFFIDNFFLDILHLCVVQISANKALQRTDNVFGVGGFLTIVTSPMERCLGPKATKDLQYR